MTDPTTELQVEYKVADDDGYFLIRGGDCPGLTDVFYVDRTETLQEGMKRRVLTMNVDQLKNLIRALERRLPEAEAEDRGEAP